MQGYSKNAIPEKEPSINYFINPIPIDSSEEAYFNGEAYRIITLFQYEDPQTKARIFMTDKDAFKRTNFRRV